MVGRGHVITFMVKKDQFDGGYYIYHTYGLCTFPFGKQVQSYPWSLKPHGGVMYKNYLYTKRKKSDYENGKI